MELIQSIIEKEEKYNECYDVRMITSHNATHTPKSIIQKRKYEIITTNNNFNYQSLNHSTTCPIIIGSDMMKDIP